MTESAELVGFELVPDARSEFAGGTVSVGDGQTIDLGELLGGSTKKITVPAGSLAEQALDSQPALRRCKPATKETEIDVNVDVSDQPDPAAEESDESPAPDVADPVPEPAGEPAGDED